MERVQFYPNTLLKERLELEAQKKGVSVSALVVEVLSEYYELMSKEEQLPLEECEQKVFDEIREYIKNKNIGFEFDLLTVSETFKNIEMVAFGKPSINRAIIGRSFSQKLKTTFTDVERVIVDGKVKKSENRATIYRKKGKSVMDNISEQVLFIGELFPNGGESYTEEEILLRLEMRFGTSKTDGKKVIKECVKECFILDVGGGNYTR